MATVPPIIVPSGEVPTVEVAPQLPFAADPSTITGWLVNMPYNAQLMGQDSGEP
jgi:hypothetical protein